MSEEKLTAVLDRLAGDHATAVWLATLESIMSAGVTVCPRGKRTLELPQRTTVVDMNHPLVLSPARRLSYRFAAAEALWIVAGDNHVEPLAKYAPRMREFSDDGVTLAGAYGPRIHDQFEYVVNALLRDRDTRQAVLTIWKPCPAPSKDIPCTVAMDFKIRDGRLNCHVFMRSSDAWLGLPYDTFSFSMVAARIACTYNQLIGIDGQEVTLGKLHLTAASSHLYAENFDGAEACVAEDVAPRGRPVPSGPILRGAWEEIERHLVTLRDAPGLVNLWEPLP